MKPIQKSETFKEETPSIFDTKISVFKFPVTNKTELVNVRISTVAKWIKARRYYMQTTALRSISDKAENTKYKTQNFYHATWSGIFSYGNDKSLEKHSGLICIDIDNLEQKELQRTNEIIKNDPHTVISFISPNGNGIKVLFRIDITKHSQKAYYESISAYIVRKCNLPEIRKIDSSCSNVSRSCFLPMDPNIYLTSNPEPPEFEIDPAFQLNNHVKGGLEGEKIQENTYKFSSKEEAIQWATKLIETAPDGSKHNILCKVSYLFGGFLNETDFTSDIAYNILKEAIDKRTCDDYKKAYKTIKECLQAGFLNPIPETVHFQKLDRKRIIHLITQGEKGLADILASLVKGKYLYNFTKKNWMYYNSRHWQDDSKISIRHKSISVIKKCLLNLSTELEKEITEGSSIEQNLTLEMQNQLNILKITVKNLKNSAQKINKLSVLKNMLELAAPLVPALSDEFDLDPYLFNLNNGTFDFRTFKLIKHRPEDKLSIYSNINYDPEATCPNWMAFLEYIFNNDSETIKYIQKCLGYCMTGLTDMQLLFFFFGKGANGKSTFLKVAQRLLNNCYLNIPIEAFLKGNRQSTIEYYIAQIKGARMVVASEIPEGEVLNESKVKDFTGGEDLKGRPIYQNPLSFKPTHKLFLCGNHKPKINGTDHGIWRRFRIIPFSRTIKKPRPMNDVMAELDPELSGIFNWAVEGYKLYKIEGMISPESVENATREFQVECDTFLGYILERCNVNKHLRCTCALLYEEYQKWCFKVGEYPFTNRQFSQALKDRGFEGKNSTGNKLYFHGIDLNDSVKKRRDEADNKVTNFAAMSKKR